MKNRQFCESCLYEESCAAYENSYFYTSRETEEFDECLDYEKVGASDTSQYLNDLIDRQTYYDRCCGESMGAVEIDYKALHRTLRALGA